MSSDLLIDQNDVMTDTSASESGSGNTPDPRSATAAGALKSYFREYSKTDPTLRQYEEMSTTT
jgi:hypothetical protein